MEIIFEMIAACRHGLALAGDLPAGVPASLFVAGLAGSMVHCVGMCSPFVIGQVVADSGRISSGYGEWRRLAGALLLPYHAGRVGTYALLGAVAGASTSWFASTPAFAWISALLLALGAVLMVTQAIGVATSLSVPWARFVTRAGSALFAANHWAARGALGAVLGLLPCGIVYGALGVAASSGSSARGALAMAAFGLGTMPTLVAVGWGGTLLRRRWRDVARWTAVPLLILNATLMVALAGTRL